MVSNSTVIAREWAQQLPKEFAKRLADALRDGPDAIHALQATTVLPISRAAVQQALRFAEVGVGPYIAGALSAHLECLAEEPIITPVWTGPETERPSGRLTLAVLADLIAEAQSEIFLASYATLPSAEVRAALAGSAERGVEITLLLERHHDNPQFSHHGEPFPGLVARRLCWPALSRPAGASMHAKILIIDRRTALVGSANLTDYGLERNLECGLLIRGGDVPRAITEHLLNLSVLEVI
jgi:phosphatidylserine/phosphatidylglycerophosphate/cardiolipin synthase-like enzyme